jgi:hypothetical protein
LLSRVLHLYTYFARRGGASSPSVKQRGLRAAVR